MQSLDIVIPAFNAEHCLHSTLDAVFAQSVPAEIVLGVVVVNNRSTDTTGRLIDQWQDKGVRRVNHNDEQGRSVARNAGVAASTADYVLLLDADCKLLGSDCLNVVADAMAQRVAAGFGYATGSSDNFWGRYHRSLRAKRITEGWLGWTTQCCLIKRDLFEAVGGLSTDYEYYGFEDRDFFCSLKANKNSGELLSLPALNVLHEDDITTKDVFDKMYIAARYSSAVFRRNFPKEYLATSYWKVDIDTAPAYMTVMLRLLKPLQPIVTRIADFLSRRKNTPLFLGRPFIKLSSALSYFQGTIDRNRDK